MVQFTTVAIAALAVLSGTVIAVDCTAGRTYCGYELQGLGACVPFPLLLSLSLSTPIASICSLYPGTKKPKKNDTKIWV